MSIIIWKILNYFTNRELPLYISLSNASSPSQHLFNDFSSTFYILRMNFISLSANNCIFRSNKISIMNNYLMIIMQISEACIAPPAVRADHQCISWYENNLKKKILYILICILLGYIRNPIPMPFKLFKIFNFLN